MRVDVAGPAFDAVAHALAFVAVPSDAPVVTRAASLFDARYAAWARTALPRDAVEPVARDAALVASLLANAPRGERLQALLALHSDARCLARSAAHDLEDDGVAAAWARAMLLDLARDAAPLVEVARCVVGLIALPYERAWQEFFAPSAPRATQEVAACLEAIVDVAPQIRSTRVALSHSLGARGRVIPIDGAAGVVVGAPADWCERSADDAAALVVHEVAVSLAADEVRDASTEIAWARAERAAIDAVASLVAGTALERAHARFRASVSVADLPRAEPELTRRLLSKLAR